MSDIKFKIEDQVVEIPHKIAMMSVLLRTTLDTTLPVEKDDNDIPIVCIATTRDVQILINYYNNGTIDDDILEAFDRLIIEPKITTLDRLAYYWIDKICPVDLRDKKLITTHIRVIPENTNGYCTLNDICKPVRRFQNYGILLKNIEKPTLYTLIKIDENGPRDNIIITYSKPSTEEQYIILDDICYNAYDTLKKYKNSYRYMLVISDYPKLYSYIDYIKYNVATLHIH